MSGTLRHLCESTQLFGVHRLSCWRGHSIRLSRGNILQCRKFSDAIIDKVDFQPIYLVQIESITILILITAYLRPADDVLGELVSMMTKLHLSDSGRVDLCKPVCLIFCTNLAESLPPRVPVQFAFYLLTNKCWG